MKAFELPAETKAATGFTHKFIVTHEDLTESTADTDQTIELLALPAGSVVTNAAYRLVTPFADASDSALNDTKIQLGDNDDDDEYIAQTQVNENGEVSFKAAAPASVPFAYVADKKLELLVESMTAKSLSDIDTGELHIFAGVTKLASL